MAASNCQHWDVVSLFLQIYSIHLLNSSLSLGSFEVELYWKHAPNTCRNFAELARRGYYNHTIFHRIISGKILVNHKFNDESYPLSVDFAILDFMIQGGDPTGTGRGGSSIYGGEFKDEIHSELRHSGAGILAMANSGANTNGSQFYITLAPTQHLDGKHTIFGRVYSGMSVIKRIGMVETDNNDRPTEDVEIVSATIDKYWKFNSIL